jgi:prepilin-type N-terminal cleavage/methylation domain-containing protein/prepilin-type processing-associated H-X9-DG protein
MNSCLHAAAVKSPSGVWLRRPGAHGFTLTEVLVVISIIIVIAAIAIPTMARVRKSAANTQAISNLKSLGAYVTLLEQDNPTGFTAWDYQPGHHEINWKGRLISSGLGQPEELAKVTFSPAWNPKSATTSNGGIEPWFGFGLDTGSYIYQTDPKTGRTIYRLPRDLNLLDNPSSRILFIDSISRKIGGKGDKSKNWQAVTVSLSGSSNSNQNAEGVVHLRNNGRANALFVDGSVQALTPKDIRASLQRAGTSTGPFVYWDEKLNEHTQN